MHRFVFLLAVVALACTSTKDEPIRARVDASNEIVDVPYGSVNGDLLNRSPYERVRFEFDAAPDSFEAEMDSPGPHQFLLAALELDDRGSLFRPDQLDTVRKMIATEGAERGAIVFVFVHGWKHNATPCDQNLACFRKVLTHLTYTEDRRAGTADARRVIGIYVGWRGLSSCREPAKELSFWARKRAAERIGGAVARDALQTIQQSVLALRRNAAGRDSTLIIVGHSFGAALVYRAAEPYLNQELSYARRHVRAKQEAVLPGISGFADLVVLVNPAFEAERLNPLVKLVRAVKRDALRFNDTQVPRLVVVSSVGDLPTHFAFPVGRFLSLVSHPADLLRWPPYWARYLITAGNYRPFHTHRAEALVKLASSTETEVTSDNCHTGTLPATYKSCGCKAPSFADALRQRGVTYGLAAGGGEKIGNVRLEPTPRHVPNAPVWVISARRDVSSGHGDVFNPTFVSFLHALIEDVIKQ